MKYLEATELIKNLSKKYSVIMEDHFTAFYKEEDHFTVFYKDYPIAAIGCVDSSRYQVVLYVDNSYFGKLPFSNKLYMILSELSVTPCANRYNLYNVIISNTDSLLTVYGHRLILGKTKFSTYGITSKYLKHDKYMFTDGELMDLINYLLTLPNGNKLAKIAELGKTLVE